MGALQIEVVQNRARVDGEHEVRSTRSDGAPAVCDGAAEGGELGAILKAAKMARDVRRLAHVARDHQSERPGRLRGTLAPRLRLLLHYVQQDGHQVLHIVHHKYILIYGYMSIRYTVLLRRILKVKQFVELIYAVFKLQLMYSKSSEH